MAAYLAHAWAVIHALDPRGTRARVRRHAESGYIVFLLVLAASCASLVAITWGLHEVHEFQGSARTARVALTMLALGESWLLIHTHLRLSLRQGVLPAPTGRRRARAGPALSGREGTGLPGLSLLRLRDRHDGAGLRCRRDLAPHAAPDPRARRCGFRVQSRRTSAGSESRQRHHPVVRYAPAVSASSALNTILKGVRRRRCLHHRQAPRAGQPRVPRERDALFHVDPVAGTGPRGDGRMGVSRRARLAGRSHRGDRICDRLSRSRRRPASHKPMPMRATAANAQCSMRSRSPRSLSSTSPKR